MISKKHKPEGGGGTPLSPDLALPPGTGSPPGMGTGSPTGTGMGSPPGMGTGPLPLFPAVPNAPHATVMENKHVTNYLLKYKYDLINDFHHKYCSRSV